MIEPSASMTDMSAGRPLRNVLVIAYYFPPMGLSGVQRTLKFVKYLPQFGWQPTVITVTPTGYFAQDYTLLDELLPLKVDIVRVGSIDPNRLFRRKGVVRLPSEPARKILTFLSDTFFIPDNKIGWKLAAIKKAEEILKSQRFEIIFATAPPFTDFLIGRELHNRHGIPLVMDYRDIWHEYPYKYYPTPLHRYLNYRLEKRTLRSASAVITTNRRVKELLLNRYRFLHYNDITIIPQGFDPDDLRDAKRQTESVTASPKKMRIAHAGTFYGDLHLQPFLRAVNMSVKKNPQLRDHLEIHFIGAFRDAERKVIASFGLNGLVHIHGYLDHKRCVQELMSSDVLWLTLGNDLQSPGKVYEYLGTRRPILACAPEGFIKQAILEAEAGTTVDPGDTVGISSAILNFFERHQRGTLPKPREDVIERYNRINLTGELAKIFGFLSEH